MKSYRLPLSFLLIILLFLFFGVFTTRGLFLQDHLTRQIYEHPLVVSNASLIAGLNITKMHRSMKDVVLANTTGERKMALKAVDAGEAEVYRQLDIVRVQILGNEGQALDEIKTLRGIIPICSHCKQIRDDQGMWKQLESYIRAHSEAEFSHGICPKCMEEHYA